jgi:hypothetical protein
MNENCSEFVTMDGGGKKTEGGGSVGHLSMSKS